MVEPREPYRTHHMLLPVIGSLGASQLTLCLNGNVKYYRQPDASCTLEHKQHTHLHTKTVTCIKKKNQYAHSIHLHMCRHLQYTIACIKHGLLSRGHNYDFASLCGSHQSIPWECCATLCWAFASFPLLCTIVSIIHTSNVLKGFRVICWMALLVFDLV